jgi:hypothetical protein
MCAVGSCGDTKYYIVAPCRFHKAVTIRFNRTFKRTPKNLLVTTVWKSLYTNNTIIYHGFFYYLDIARAQRKAKEVPALTDI